MPAIHVDNETLRALLESEAARLSHYSIGFVLPRAANGLPDADLAGSGTLVTIDDIFGILTANHVIELLIDNKYVGLILPTASKELHNLSFKSVDFVRRVSFCAQGAAENGPDLGKLVPPPDVLSTLRARQSFYNLSNRRGRMLQKPDALQNGLWILSGIAGEWVGDALVSKKR
jgi:hypothetical protein